MLFCGIDLLGLIQQCLSLKPVNGWTFSTLILCLCAVIVLEREGAAGKAPLLACGLLCYISTFNTWGCLCSIRRCNQFPGFGSGLSFTFKRSAVCMLSSEFSSWQKFIEFRLGGASCVFFKMPCLGTFPMKKQLCFSLCSGQRLSLLYYWVLHC